MLAVNFQGFGIDGKQVCNILLWSNTQVFLEVRDIRENHIVIFDAKFGSVLDICSYMYLQDFIEFIYESK